MRFGDVLKAKRKALGWTGAELIRRADLGYRTRVTEFERKQDTRKPSQPEVDQIVAAMAEARPNKTPEINPGTWVRDLYELYRAAGFQLPSPNEHDKVATMLRQHRRGQASKGQGVPQPLEIGWFPWGDFMVDANGMPSGPGYEICERVARLLGVRFNYIEQDLGDLGSSLHADEIKLIAPMMRTPIREWEFWFSDPLPGFRAGINIVADECEAQDVLGIRTAYESLGKIPWGRLEINTVAGGVPLDLIHYLLGAPQAATVDLDESHLSFQAGCESVMERPLSKGAKLRVFIADDIAARAFVVTTNKSKNKPACLLVGHREVQFPIAFATADLEPQLMTAIEHCFDRMRADGFFMRLFIDYPVVRFACNTRELSCVPTAVLPYARGALELVKALDEEKRNWAIKVSEELNTLRKLEYTGWSK